MGERVGLRGGYIFYAYGQVGDEVACKLTKEARCEEIREKKQESRVTNYGENQTT